MLWTSRLSPLVPGSVPGRSAVLNDAVLNDAVLNDTATRKTVRRRRSWYRRRLRVQRTMAALVVGTVIVGACWQNAARYFSLPSLHSSQVLPESFWTRGNVRKDLAFMAA